MSHSCLEPGQVRGWVMGGWEVPCEYWEPNPGPLQEEQVLLAVSHFSSPSFLILSQGLILQPRQTLNSLCSPGWSWTWDLLPPSQVAGLCHQAQLITCILNTECQTPFYLCCLAGCRHLFQTASFLYDGLYVSTQPAQWLGMFHYAPYLPEYVQTQVSSDTWPASSCRQCLARSHFKRGNRIRNSG